MAEAVCVCLGVHKVKSTSFSFYILCLDQWASKKNNNPKHQYYKSAIPHKQRLINTAAEPFVLLEARDLFLLLFLYPSCLIEGL